MFELALPWALLLLPLPLIFWLAVPRAHLQLPTALNVPFFDAMQGIVEQNKRVLSVRGWLLIPALIWLSLVVALAGPRWVGEPLPIVREGYNIMMALDLSASMQTQDMVFQDHYVSRLSVVKRAAAQFVKDRSGDKIGLILFGTRAYLQTPLTYDRQNILTRITDATAGLAGGNTSIGEAIGLAVKRLEKVPDTGRIIILLTDGANTSGIVTPLKAAEIAKSDGIKIYTIGLGADELNNGFLLPQLSADLDEETLKKIAEMTGGRYFRATDAETLRSIYRTINQLETVKQEQSTVRPQKEYYPWFVACALFLFFYWMIKASNLIVRVRFFQRREVIKS